MKKAIIISLASLAAIGAAVAGYVFWYNLESNMRLIERGIKIWSLESLKINDTQV